MGCWEQFGGDGAPTVHALRPECLGYGSSVHEQRCDHTRIIRINYGYTNAVLLSVRREDAAFALFRLTRVFELCD